MRYGDVCSTFCTKLQRRLCGIGHCREPIGGRSKNDGQWLRGLHRLGDRAQEIAQRIGRLFDDGELCQSLGDNACLRGGPHTEWDGVV